MRDVLQSSGGIFVKKKIVSMVLCTSIFLSYCIDVAAISDTNALSNQDIVYDYDIASGTDAAEDADIADNVDNANDNDDQTFEMPADYHGYREVDVEWGDEDEGVYQTYGLLQASSYPTSYDSREYDCLTPVKNQNPWGACWSFATLGAGEASMIKQGYASLSNAPNYSEYQLAYFFYHDKQDPLHNIDNDKMAITNGENFLDFGGNVLMASLALAGWVGAVNEDETGYPTEEPLPDLSNNIAVSKDAAHLQNAYMVSKVSNQSGNQIKQLIMDYGGVATGFYFDTYYCFRAENGDVTYNYQGSLSADHAIMIVGWDDNYSKNNFNPSFAPTSDGAWLVRNSWGESNYPYIWVSYEDVRLKESKAVACVFEPSDNYDFNYQYDGNFGLDYIKFANPVIANVYTASGAEVENIEAVGFALNSKKVNYSIQIYVNPTDDSDPTSGVPMLSTPQTGTTDYLGYMTVKLDNPVTVKKGDKFAVVISLSHSSGYVGVFADMDGYAWNGTVLFDSSTKRGQSFFKENSDTFCDCLDFIDEKGDDVEDLCLRIKAYTKAAPSGTVVDSTVDLSKASVSSISDYVYTGTAVTPDPVLTYNGRTLIKGTDYTVAYSNNIYVGTATVTISGRNNYKGTRTFTFRITPLDITSTSITYTTSYKFTGNNITPAPTVKYSGKTLVSGTDYTVSYTDNRNIGTATIIISGKGNCTGSRSLTFTIKGADSYETVYNGVDYSAVYDFNYYISRYSDLWKAFGWDTKATLAHFVNNGMKEGRQAKSDFEVWSYKNAYADLRSAFGSNLTQYYLHYINNGRYEGRIAKGISVQQGGTTVYNGVDYSAVYNYNYYLEHNPDIKSAYNGDEDATIAHFVNSGMNEGRQGNATFNVYSYAYRYSDLRRAFKNDLKSYYIHYIYNGKNEGRIGIGTSTMQNTMTKYNGVDYSLVYDYNYYISHNADLKNEFGLDDESALIHFIVFGMSEGRQAKSTFNVTNYKNRYSDLSKAFGNSTRSYYQHYIACGYKEGRDAK